MSLFKIELEVILYIACYAFVIGFFLLGRHLAKKRQKISVTNNSLEDVSVVIPFRNEEKNLSNFMQSLSFLTSLPKEFIFVDDHSEDGSLNQLKGFPFPHQILKLASNEKGKKAALAKGIHHSQTEFILTWDADIEVQKSYFDSLRKCEWLDLLILPVEMRGSKWIEGFFAMDYQLQTQSNVAISGFFRPITASGANLFFRKSVYKELEKERTDFNILSGDDQFLLKAFRIKKKRVGLVSEKDLKVRTHAPMSLSEGLSQRKRWLSKTSKVGDNLATGFGLFVFILQLTYYSFAWFQLVQGNWLGTILMILVKGELDAFLATYKFQDQFHTFQVFVYQLVYPFYMIYLLVFGFVGKTTWKGRN